MGKIIANGGFPGKIVGNCGENMGKPLGFKGENQLYMSLFEEFEHCLKKYLLQSISPIVG